MDVTADDFRRAYQLLSDESLMEVDTSELVELARTCHAEEVARRGLTPASDDEASNDSESHPGSGVAEDELVCIVEYDHLDEADMARGLLEAEEIPASVEGEPGVARLMVPAGLAEQALRMLASPLSDEELAAQAEAAGIEEMEAEEQAEEAGEQL